MRTVTKVGIALVLLALGGLWAVQMHSLRENRTRLEALEARMVERPGASARLEPSGTLELFELQQRLVALESIVSQLGRGTNQMAASKPVRLSGQNLEELRRKLLDPAVSEKDRLQALRLLRRNGGLSDDALASAIQWLQTSQDPAMRREILQQMDGVTNAVLRQPLLDLAAAPDRRLREQAVENLRRFVADAEVEKRLWALAQSDPDPAVREQAEEALRKGAMTPERAGRLQQLAADPQAGLDERLTALRALHRAGADIGDASTAIAQLVQSSADPVARAKVFRALDGVHDPRLLAPLVNGLQDPSPVVRQEAAEVIGRFAADPTIRQWLEHVAQSDADSQVRREAFQALKKLQKGRP